MRLASLLVLPLVTGCFLDPSCGQENRELTVYAQLTTPDALGSPQVYATILQYKASRQAISIGWSLNVPDLESHVQSVSFVEGATGSLIADLPLPASDAGSVVEVPFDDSHAGDRVYEMFVHNEIAVVVVTDIPGRERIVRTLEYQGGTDWHTPSCD